MTQLDYFNECNTGPWITGGLDVQYKVVDRVLYFQCTHSKLDWFFNFLFIEDVYKNSDIQFRTHRGFKDLWLSVMDDIEKLDFNIIVGYSQGAALAGFAHENYFHRNKVEPNSIVFGCPLFLYKPNDELLQRFTKFSRFNNPKDIVSLNPPKYFGYSAPGTNTILPGGKLKRPSSIGFFEWLSHHTPTEYRERLAIYNS